MLRSVISMVVGVYRVAMKYDAGRKLDNRLPRIGE